MISGNKPREKSSTAKKHAFEEGEATPVGAPCADGVDDCGDEPQAITAEYHVPGVTLN
jgi:hypothetical protein